MRLLVVSGFCAVLCTAALAGHAVVTLGDARVRYDDARWGAVVLSGNIHFEPRGDIAHKIDPVALRVADGPAACEELATHALDLGHYDRSEVAREPMRLGGVEGIRLSAHTGCRNATPRGEVACVKVKDRAYLLSALQPGCGGRNLFSGLDPLAEIADGISFWGTER